jgi:hypothetical protein
MVTVLKNLQYWPEKKESKHMIEVKEFIMRLLPG